MKLLNKLKIFIAMIFFFFGTITEITIAEDHYKVSINYKRFDQEYKNWNLWLWEEGREGKEVFFQEDTSYGKNRVVEIKKDRDVTKVGFLLKRGQWEDRDVPKDRYILLNKENIDVYLIEGDEKIYDSLESVDLVPTIKYGEISKLNEIKFKLMIPLERGENSFKVVDSNGKEYSIKEVVAQGDKIVEGSLILDEKLDLDRAYTLYTKNHDPISLVANSVFSEGDFERRYTYNGDDLGATYSKESTKFRVWSPIAESVSLNLYREGNGDNLIKTLSMKKDKKGTWYLEVKEDLENIYYTYTVKVNGEESEAVDLYARSVGVNGDRGMILDLGKTNPVGWEDINQTKIAKMSDAMVYEIHIRDFSIDKSSGIGAKGKYLGMIEEGSRNSEGDLTGIDHLKDLGVTHIQILPSADYASVDEIRLDTAQFNWGYDPKNYNVPEGSYSSNPYDGRVRVKEFKEMVQGLHKKGIGVIMDVVYNHTAYTENSNFNKIVPNYYYRKNEGNFSNASACGNETASERAMMRKYIVDSVVYWAKEYKVDGFRFDLMGIHDIETMNLVREALDKVNPNIIIYGEPWAASESPLSEDLRSVKRNTMKLNRIGVFNDDIRDGIKGSVFNSKDRGFATGKTGEEERIKFGIVGATKHSQVNYNEPWANSPIQSINYASAHDNLTLWDKINSSVEGSLEEKIRMNKLSAAIVFTSQGVPFFQGGEEILRSKPMENGGFNSNSYNANDGVNSIKWNEKTVNKDVYDYYKGLIEFRKSNSGLRMSTTADVQKNLEFLNGLPKDVIGYIIKQKNSSGKSEEIMVIHNGSKKDFLLELPENSWNIYANDEKAGDKKLGEVEKRVEIPRVSTLILKSK
ncbi:type I pullulanase [uncultured Fusobacterium sp.]|jgi:pullulanase|uniref:type I pullulanase n=1 Tax=uncultured Fusobacterium sp. TaxID=159267 RepID=UPI00265DA7A7|nr:type I pullulanase [uncultured Fusobacterium sp.]